MSYESATHLANVVKDKLSELVSGNFCGCYIHIRHVPEISVGAII